MSDHTITWTQDRFGITAKITCAGGPDAPCHQSCPHGCEEWGANHEHALADYGTCLAVEGMEATVGGALFEVGPHSAGTVPHNGPVTVHWDGGWGWGYADEPAASAEPARLSSNDPEPPVGTIVVTDGWGVWRRFDAEPRSWAVLGDSDDTESWTRVAGNYGPVTVLVPGAGL